MDPHELSVAGWGAVDLNVIADRLRQEIRRRRLPLAKQVLCGDTDLPPCGPDVLKALVVVKTHEEPHTHPNSDLIVVALEGGGHFDLHPGRLDVPKGSVGVIPRNVVHAFHNDNPDGDTVLFATFSPADAASVPIPTR